MPRFETGTPRQELNLNAVIGNNSANALEDVFCFMGETQMGEPDKPTVVQSEREFLQKFGSLKNGFFQVCIKALRGGVKLCISRVSHRNTDGSLSATKAASVLSINQAPAFFAKNIGDWGNLLKSKIIVGRVTGTVKILVQLSNIEVESYTISEQPSAEDIEIANANLRYISLNSLLSNQQLIATSDFDPFSGGTNGVQVTASDYIGRQELQTGVWAFDNLRNIKFVSAPDIALNSVDNAITQYAQSRSAIALLRGPIGSTGDACVKYRNCETPYTGAKIDSFWAWCFMGGVSVIDATTSLETNISPIADVCISIAKKNKFGKVYESFAIEEYGKISGAVGVDYNVLIASRRTESDSVFNNGLNAVVVDENGTIKVWGDNTLAVDFSALSFTGNVEYVQSLILRIKPILSKYIHRINKVSTWNLMYREIKKVLDEYLTEIGDKRPQGDGKIGSYIYSGDQNASKIDAENLKVNTVEGVNSGVYRVILDVQLISTMRFIRLDFNASLKGASVTVVPN